MGHNRSVRGLIVALTFLMPGLVLSASAFGAVGFAASGARWIPGFANAPSDTDAREAAPTDPATAREAQLDPEAAPAMEPPASAGNTPVETPDDPTPEGATAAPVAPAPDETTSAPTAPSAPTPAADAPGQAASADPQATDRAPLEIRFEFKGASWDQVLDFFARTTGLPVVKETPAPDGTVDYLSPRAYDLDEALRTLNILLQTRGVMLRVESDKLYLQKLEDMKRENIPTFVGRIPAEITDDQVVTVVLPLLNAEAKPVAEWLSQMVASYGSVTPLEKQNAIVLVETAAQVRRLQQLVEEIDREDVENVVEYLPLKYAKATELVQSLTALMGERRVEYVINPQDNKRVKLEDNRLAGLSITADERTNAIIARGTRAKIDQLRGVIALLDVPGGKDAREIRTFQLSRLAPEDAAKRLDQLFATASKQDRPIVMADESIGCVTVVGPTGAIAEAATFLRDVDGLAGAVGGAGDVERVVVVAPLAHLEAPAAIAALRSLLTPRQLATMSLLPGADGDSVTMAGAAIDVDSGRAILEAIDRPSREDRQVRLMRLDAVDPAAVVAKAKTLFEAQRNPASPAGALTADFDAGSGSIVVVGAPEEVSRFASLVDQIQQVTQPRPDIRLLQLEHAKASEAATFVSGLLEGRIARLAAAGMEPPRLEAIDPINALLVAASPTQQQIIEQLVRSVDVPAQQEMPPLRILQLRTADAVNLAATLNANYARRSVEERAAKPVTITADPQINALLVAAHPDIMPEIESIANTLNDADRFRADEGREIRIFPLRVARAVDLARTIDEMFPPPPVPVDPRGRPRPELQEPREVVVRGDSQTNSLIVDAPAARMQEFEHLVEQLDRQEISEATEIRTWRVVHADLDSAAETIRQLAAGGALVPAGTRKSPVIVSTDPSTGTLIVSGPPEAFEKIGEVIETIDARRAGPATQLRFFKLTAARADQVAPMLREILGSRISETIPEAVVHLESLLKVTADPRSNALIISAPESIMPVAEELVRQLDTTAAASPNDAVIRVKALTFADSRELAQSLTQAIATMTSRTTGQPLDVRLTAAPGSNALIMVGMDADLKEVEALITPLDERPALDAIDARTFELAHAEAARIAPIVQRLLADQQETDPRIVLERLRRSRGQIDTTPPIRVEADQRTNSLIVSGPQRTVSLAQTLIAQLDRPDASADRTFTTFTPANADPAQLAQAVQRVMSATAPEGRRGTLEIVPESQTGALVVIGNADETARARELLAEWDGVALTAPTVDLRVIALEHSDARTVAPAVNAILQDRSRWPASLRNLARAGITVAQPSATADPAGNRLLLSAPAELIAVAERVIRELDAPREGGATIELRVFTLERARAADVAGALRGAMDARAATRPNEPKPSVSAEPSSNAVVVAATPDQLRHVEQIIKPLDAAGTPDQQQVRTMFLRHARASEVAPLVESLLAERELISAQDLPTWAQVDYVRMRQESRGDRPEVRVVADERMNALVIAAPPAVLNAAEQMVAQLDVAAPAEGDRLGSVRVLTLENADAGELAMSLEAIFDATRVEEEPPSIRVNEGSNSLIIRATNAQFAVIERVAKEVDAATIATSRQMRTVPIDPSKASAEEVAAMLRRLLGRDGGPAVEVISVEELLKRQAEEAAKSAPGGARSHATPATPASFAAPTPAATSAMLGALVMATVDSEIVGPPAPAAEDEPAWFAADDTAPAPSTSAPGTPAPVQEASPSIDRSSAPNAAERRPSASTTLAQAAPAAEAPRSSAPPGADVAPEAQEPGLTIAVDRRTNSLIVIGSPRAVDRVAALAAQAQDEIPSQPTPVRVLALPEGADPERLRGLVQQTLDRLAAPGGGRGRIGQRIGLIADAATNGLVVVASEPDFAVVTDLVMALSRPSAVDELTVKVYPLQSITAERAAASLRSLLDPAGRGRGPMRDLAITLLANGESIDAIFDPARVRISSDPAGNALVVMGPPDAIGFLDRVVTVIDRATPDTSSLRLMPLRYAEAAQVRNAVRDIFRARTLPGGRSPELAVDERTNTLIVTAAPEQLTEIENLLAQLDRPMEEDVHPLRIIDLKVADAKAVADILNRVVVGADQARRASTLVLPDAASGVLLVRASNDVNAEIDRVVEELDRPGTRDFPVRTIVLQHADAGAVAQAVQRFYDDRAAIAGGNRGRRALARNVSVIGDPASATLLVAASDEDFEQVKAIVERFDAAEQHDALDFRVLPLRHAKAADIEQTVQSLVDQLIWSQPSFIFGGGRREQGRRDEVAVHAEPRLNALVVTGTGDKFGLVERLVEQLDAPGGAGQRVVRLYRPQHADLDMLASVLREALDIENRSRRWWQPPDPSRPSVQIDERTRTIIVAADERSQTEVEAILGAVDVPASTAPMRTDVVQVEYARAGEIARAITAFLAERSAISGTASPSIAVVPSESTNTLLISAAEADVAMVRDLLARLDQPSNAGDRVIEILPLRDGQAQEIARLVSQQFPRAQGGQGVVVTADSRTNSVIVNAPGRDFPEVKALIQRLDAPSDSDVTIIRTYTLTGARAEDASRLLASTLQLDSTGRTAGAVIQGDDGKPVEIKARIVPDRRSNTLVVTATPESLPIIESLIRQLDDVPAASPIEYRIIRLEHAVAADASYTLRQLVRGEAGEPSPRIDYNRLENQLIVGATADQFEQIDRILKELDQPAESRRLTDFVPLRFADAEQLQEALSYFYGPLAMDADTPGKQGVRIVADPATNSLVISADEAEWEGIRALLAKLDSEEYDASLQLRVMPLLHADARSVAQAINDAFQGRISRERQIESAQRAAREPQGQDRRDGTPPTVLVQSEEWVSAAAEELTNSVIVYASRPNFERIEHIVQQLDQPGFGMLPPPRVIPVQSGDPVRIAEALTTMFAPEAIPGRGARQGRHGLRIVGDQAASAIIVRASAEEFEQIAVLADALQQQSQAQGLSVKVLPLKSSPAPRVAAAIREAFAAKAKQVNAPLSISVDAASNALVVASSGPLFDEIAATVEQMDSLSPGAGQAIFVIDLQHVAPEAARSVIETIGLDKPQPENSVSRIVSDPIKVSIMPGRRALVIVANPGDRETIVGLLKAIDTEPALASSQVRVVKLRNAQAKAIAALLGEVLRPAEQQSATPLAQAVREQVRRLSFRRDGAQENDLDLDLATPIKVVPDEVSNAILIASTPGNVAALEQVIAMLDTVPVTDAVTVQIFPLENIAAEQFSRIVRDLFTQGKRLGRVPGTEIDAVPAGTAGRALLDEVAISIDDRTNTVIVAGKEDAVALVEVLVRRIDTDVATGWVEPRILPLRHADADQLAETLQAVLVEGAQDLPESSPLRRQVARLRLLRDGGSDPLQADSFRPMTRTVIRAESQLNALIVVATPANLDVVSELVRQLDVEAASPSALVRIYPLEHASAAKLASVVTKLFDDQFQSKAIRSEDRVRVQADERTNALIVSTSTRSFAVLESLLRSLDAPVPLELREIRTLPVVNASAPRLAAMVQELMDARLERMRKVQPETADLEKTVVVADARTNSLVVAAGNESFEVVKRLVEQLDSAQSIDSALVQVVPLAKANAERIAQAVTSIMERRYADLPVDVRRSTRPLILTDTRSNSLLVAASPEDFKAVEDLVRKLEATPMNPAVGLHVLPLEVARAEILAPRLETLMRDRQRSLGESATPSDTVSVQPETGSNSLIIAASAENYEIIRGLVDVLSRTESELADGRRVEVITVSRSRAQDLVPIVQEMYVNEENRRRGDGSVRVSAEARINAVLVTGTEADVDAIKRLVGRLEGSRPDTVVEIKYIPLASANAIETVGLIENILSGRNVAGRRQGQQATVLKYLREMGDGTTTETEVNAAIRESINLTPDIRTNTIIVSAPRDSMSMIERMIRDLDESSTGSQSIRVFKLKNADAEAMAQILFDLFNLRQRDDLLVLKPRESMGAGLSAPDADGIGAAASGLGGLGAIELTAVPDERQQLSITVDSRTNSLLVSASPMYLDLVSQVVQELDAEEANERETKIFRLKNAVAEDVARVVSNFVTEDQRKLIETLGSEQLPSAARLLEREVTIVGDSQTNTVLITASPRYMEAVERMVRELDVDPPQVLIQVLLAEVTLDAQDALGIDFEGEFNIGNTAVSAGYGLASAFLGSIGLPPSSTGIPNVAVVGNDFRLVINALRAAGRVQLLSNPSVMAANNEPAEIQVGQTIRLPEAISITSGQQQSAVVPEDIGIILKVTPNINPDGFVRMTINPEISELSSNTTKISENFESPIIDRRRADTTVTVRDGETVVIGGLISDRYERILNRVPFFGDMPLVGWLFRSEKEMTRKTELLIVLTPYVIMSPSQLTADERQAYTLDEIDRLSMPDVLKEQLQRSRLRGTGLEFGSESEMQKARFMELEQFSERGGEQHQGHSPETVPPTHQSSPQPGSGAPSRKGSP